MKTKIAILVFFISSSSLLFAQSGILSGTLLDKDGSPIPGASITVKGKNIGTQTDFDGNYSINSNVGDVLVFTYIGFTSKEVPVTAEMFSDNLNTQIVKNIPAQPIFSKAYTDQLNKNRSSEFDIPDIDESNKKFTLNQQHFKHSRIKNIESGDDKIKVKIYPEDIHFEVGLNQKNSFQFVQQKNLPAIQKQFAQGRPNNGNLTWFGPETDEIFSYGPRLTNLEFDGLPYVYDSNGQLTTIGQGNGTLAQDYDESIFKTGLNTFTRLDLKVHSSKHKFNFNYTNGNTKDLFNQSGNKSNYLDFGHTSKGNLFHWNTSILYNRSRIGNANINAFHNQIYLGHLITPPSFSNQQGSTLTDGTQRSFSPHRFNNPNGALETNNNHLDYSFFKAILNNKIYVADNLNLNTGVTFSKQAEEMRFNLIQQTNGFPNRYLSNKSVETEEVSLNFSASYWHIQISDALYLNPSSDVRYKNSQLGYGLLETALLQEINSLSTQPKKSTVQLKNSLILETQFGFDMNLTLQNNSFSSSIQGSEWFLPSVKTYIGLDNHLLGYSDFLSSITFSGGFSKDVVDFPLYYNNFSHNSLQLDLEESLSYTTNNDLFISDRLDFEEVQQLDLETKISFFNHKLSIAANYYNALNRKSIFPVFSESRWRLQNIADIRNEGWEASINFFLNPYYSSSFKLDTKIVFSKNRPVVKRIHDNSLERVPIAGFQTVSKNLIIDQPAGTLVGTGFLRNENNEVVIGNDGFPLVDPQLKTLGNPVPDFNLGWSNTLSLGRFTLNFVWDYQKGGDIWNGTQNTLNYFGTSLETAQLRGTSDFIFNGVDAQGNRNSIPVDFAPSTSSVDINRWVRYGFEGVAEEAISDGSYLNLKSISLRYKINNTSEKKFFKEVVFGLFTKNIWTWTKTKGVNPYSALFGNTSGQGLHFFNLPLASELGININLKI